MTDQPSSVHLMVPKMRGEYLIAIAADDDASQPDAKTKLAEAFKAAHLPRQGRSVPRTHSTDGASRTCRCETASRSGNEAQAERAWGELRELFKRAWCRALLLEIARNRVAPRFLADQRARSQTGDW